MTRQQELVMEDLASRHGRVHVTQPYDDGSVKMTVPSCESWVISASGTPSQSRPDVSVDWDA